MRCATGSVKVYDTLSDFRLVAELQLAAEGDLTFVNDVIVTKTNAYITESSQLQFYKVREQSGGDGAKDDWWEPWCAR